jgi:hypothetical protein
MFHGPTSSGESILSAFAWGCLGSWNESIAGEYALGRWFDGVSEKTKPPLFTQLERMGLRPPAQPQARCEPTTGWNTR